MQEVNFMNGKVIFQIISKSPDINITTSSWKYNAIIRTSSRIGRISLDIWKFEGQSFQSDKGVFLTKNYEKSNKYLQ
jgi:hypothetical protein